MRKFKDFYKTCVDILDGQVTMATKGELALKATHSYIGRLPCGCVVAVTMDFGDKDTAKHVAEFIKEGLTVERVTHDYVRENFICAEDCPHQEPKFTQRSMF